MSSVLFILGKDRELSLAELRAAYPDAAFQVSGEDFVLTHLKEDITQADFDRLGGVIKVASLIGTTTQNMLEASLVEILKGYYQGKQLNYGVSVYGWSESRLRTVLIGLKKALKNAGVKSRFANQAFCNISTAQYKGLRKDGVELLVARDGNDFLIGETVASQDIDAYSRRDFDKPFRSMQVGMLPPKLAQILVNLTGLRQGTIWDPFCGGGVLLLEALLLGFDVMGSDIDERALAGARKNVAWLQREFNVTGKTDLFFHDASALLCGKKFDPIACEGDLGPPQSGRRSAGHLRPIVQELETLYVRFFENLMAMKFHGPVVIAMPFFRTQDGGEVFLDGAVTKIESMGFCPLFSPLKYARSDQVVGRMIYGFRRS